MMTRDHGGNLDAAIAQYGGTLSAWLDLSTGINPVAYPVPDLPSRSWTALPTRDDLDRLALAARRFWHVPDAAAVVIAPGASALIARMPALTDAPEICIPEPTYNEHAAAFRAFGRAVSQNVAAPAHVYVHPDNPTGRLWKAEELLGDFTVIDESFCDVAPQASHASLAGSPGTVVLKSFGKFWGLAGVRLGFMIAHASHADRMVDLLGPWPVSGAAIEIGARALNDPQWATDTRIRVEADATRLDRLMQPHSGCVGGTALFRLYELRGDRDARQMQDHLARHHIWTRIFPYSRTWLRIGLPHPDRWDQLEHALATAERPAT